MYLNKTKVDKGWIHLQHTRIAGAFARWNFKFERNSSLEYYYMSYIGT